MVGDSKLTARRQIRALTGIRFFAALDVVLFHTSGWADWSGGVLRGIVSSGYVAVSLFFVLSGFILAYTYGQRGIERREFYVARFARIYPVYALGLVLAAPFFVRDHVRAHALGSMLGRGAAVTTLLQAHVPSWALAWNPPAWSLSVEAFFYLLFPWLLPPLLQCSRTTARVIAIAAWLGSMGLIGAYLAWSGDAPTYASEGTWLDAVRYGPIARVPELVVGIVLGRELLEGARLPEIAGGLSVMATLGALALAPWLPYLLIHNGLFVPLFALVILSLATHEGRLARALGSAPLVALGDASYALYILHVPFFMIVRSTTKALAPALIETGTFRALYVVLAVVLSLVTFRAVEVPLRSLLRRRLAS
jgi:peptidoglycan/LPS O-acetylase OafA/YrhL